MKKVFVRINLKATAATRLFRAGNAWTREWQGADLSDADLQRVQAEQYLEVSDTAPGVDAEADAEAQAAEPVEAEAESEVSAKPKKAAK